MKKFLTAFPAIAAAFATNAGAMQTPPAAPLHDSQNVAKPTTSLSEDGRVTAHDEAGNALNFIIKRSEDTGFLMAQHESHASHASHSSHASHYSSRY